jgi:hypothetical protein
MSIKIGTIEKMVLSTKNINICSKPISLNHNYHIYIEASYIQQASPKVLERFRTIHIAIN